MEAVRKCTKCGKEAHNEAELDEFTKDKQCKYGRKNICKSCDYKRERKRNKKNPDVKRNSQLKYYYGISLTKYNTMFKEQKGCCKICGTHQSNLKIALAVDHCHGTEDVRGLLCSNCNTGLGMFKDNVTSLKNAIEYLQFKGI